LSSTFLLARVLFQAPSYLLLYTCLNRSYLLFLLLIPVFPAPIKPSVIKTSVKGACDYIEPSGPPRAGCYSAGEGERHVVSAERHAKRLEVAPLLALPAAVQKLTRGTTDEDIEPPWPPAAGGRWAGERSREVEHWIVRIGNLV
jgi:hypothetical protein